MNYSQIYDNTYKLTTNAIRRALISNFKKFRKKNRPFNTINNNFLQWATNYNETRFEKELMRSEQKAFAIFRNRAEYYEGERLEQIQQVLEEEVQAAYIGKTYKSYEDFISELAKYDAFSWSRTHCQNYSPYYELIYQFEKYEYFHFKNFEGHGYENSKEYTEMLDLKDPNRIEERKAREEELKAMRKEQLKNPDGVSEFIESFSDDERMVITNIFYTGVLKAKVKPRVPLTTFVKLLKIIGSYNDLSIFVQNAQSNTMYRKANAGLDYYSNESSQIDLINSILAKLKNQDCDFISDSLNVKLIEIQNSKIKNMN